MAGCDLGRSGNALRARMKRKGYKYMCFDKDREGKGLNDSYAPSAIVGRAG